MTRDDTLLIIALLAANALLVAVGVELILRTIEAQPTLRIMSSGPASNVRPMRRAQQPDDPAA